LNGLRNFCGAVAPPQKNTRGKGGEREGARNKHWRTVLVRTFTLDGTFNLGGRTKRGRGESDRWGRQERRERRVRREIWRNRKDRERFIWVDRDRGGERDRRDRRDTRKTTLLMAFNLSGPWNFSGAVAPTQKNAEGEGGERERGKGKRGDRRERRERRDRGRDWDRRGRREETALLRAFHLSGPW
jgi:hypothetical protein